MNSNVEEYLAREIEEDSRRRGDIVRLIEWYFGPADSLQAVKIARRVSGLSSLAFHRYSAEGMGLFDIDPHLVGLSEEQAWKLHNPIINVAYAYKLFKCSGWRYWDQPERREPCPEFEAGKVG